MALPIGLEMSLEVSLEMSPPFPLRPEPGKVRQETPSGAMSPRLLQLLHAAQQRQPGLLPRRPLMALRKQAPNS
jgi:hypothetical protein